MDKMIEVRPGRCVACKTCVIECAIAHSEGGTLEAAVREGISPRIILEYLEGETIPMHCRHCADAPCITVCPTRALSRANEQSPVRLDRDLCIGCTACVVVCPFGVIKRGRDGKSMLKCDLCFARLENGQEPACVSGCPTRAIRYLEVEKVSGDRRRDYLRKYKVALVAMSAETGAGSSGESA